MRSTIAERILARGEQAKTTRLPGTVELSYDGEGSWSVQLEGEEEARTMATHEVRQYLEDDLDDETLDEWEFGENNVPIEEVEVQQAEAQDPTQGPGQGARPANNTYTIWAAPENGERYVLASLTGNKADGCCKVLIEQRKLDPQVPVVLIKGNEEASRGRRPMIIAPVGGFTDVNDDFLQQSQLYQELQRTS